MKTLDEVIKACEETVSDVDRGVDIEGCYLGATETRDALHYLKHLQEYYNMSREHHEPNPALTWDELRTMEGKPVWVEVLDDNGDHYKWRGDGWYIVKDFMQGYFEE